MHNENIKFVDHTLFAWFLFCIFVSIKSQVLHIGQSQDAADL